MLGLQDGEVDEVGRRRKGKWNRKKTGESMMKMMAGLTNQYSEAWHFSLCRILIGFLTSRALSWPDGFLVCHFASLSAHSLDQLLQTPIPLPCHYWSVQLIVITRLLQHHEAVVWKLKQLCVYYPGLAWSLTVYIHSNHRRLLHDWSLIELTELLSPWKETTTKQEA